MQTVEAVANHAVNPVLLDDIYTPALNKTSENPAVKDQTKQQHQRAITELHRFLESSCDCV